MTRVIRPLLAAVSLVAGLAAAGQAQSPSKPSAQAPAAFRPPAIPLITHDPYFSIWSTSDRLTDRPTSHWTGTSQALSALVRIDGKPFRVMGHLPASVPALTQRSVTVLPLRTIYVFADSGVELAVFSGHAFADRLVHRDIHRAGEHLHRGAIGCGHAGVGQTERGAVDQVGVAGVDDPAGSGLADHFAELQRPVAFGEVFGIG